MYHPGVSLGQNKKHGQASTATILGIIIIVAIIFTGVGYTLTPSTLNTSQVKAYVNDASEEEIREVLSSVPEEILREQVEKKYPLLVEDDLGREIIIENRPEKIVSLSPSVTEILFALNLDNKIIGVSEVCDYPPKVNELVENGEIAIAGPYAKPPKTEKIVGLDPDLVITAAGTPMDSINELESLGINVLGIEGENISSVKKNIKLIGKVTGTSERAQEITERMEEKINEITKITENIPREDKPRVYYEIWELWTFGPGTFGHEVIEKAGCINIAENKKSKYPMLKEEFILNKDPEVFITGTDVRTSVDSVEKAYPGITALEENQVYILNDNIRDIVSRPGPRLPKAIREIAKLLHPELEFPS